MSAKRRHEGVPPELDPLLLQACTESGDPLLRDAMRAYWQAARARKAGAEVIELFLYDEVFERDGWTCQLCFQAIARDVPSTWKNSKSIDHVLPLSRGGNHSRANVVAAHVGCNSKKADMTPAEWESWKAEHPGWEPAPARVRACHERDRPDFAVGEAEADQHAPGAAEGS